MAKKLLIVCLGNHRRSPLAEEILSARGATVDSAGIEVDLEIAIEDGESFEYASGSDISDTLDPICIALGVTTPTGHSTKAVTQELIDWADVVYGMNDEILTKLNDRFEGEFTKFDSESDIPNWEKYETEVEESNDDPLALLKAEGEHIKRIADLIVL
jgi:protein-tyrosine-phosphatase